MFANNFGKFHNVECGLVHQSQNPSRKRSFSERTSFTSYKNTHDNLAVFIPVPLTSVSVTASVVHAVAQVEITQIYSNKEKEPIEAIYFFPVDSNGAVTHFQAELDGKIITGVVRSNEEAKAQYEKAVENKQTAFLGEENKPDIFKVSIGYLKPGAEVKVVIGYVTEVKNEADSHTIRFFLPTTIAPRYVPGSGSDDKSLELANITEFSKDPPAPMMIKVITSFQGEVKTIESPTHKITVESKGPIAEKVGWNKSVVTLNGNTTEMDRDFVLLITPTEPLQPRLYSEVLDGSTAIMTHFIPSFKLDDQKVELIIVLDRSGSMGGASIRMAQKALLLFLHSMPADCFFNVVGFGNSYHFLFAMGSTKYNDESLLHATRYAEGLKADLGGTEILEPLREIYAKPLIPGYLRQIFVITDGQVSNTDQVIGLVRTNAHKSRVFALGIGSSASHHLVEGLAQAGGGTCAFVEAENIQRQTMSQLKNALQPSLTDVKVEWKGIPETPPPVVNKEKTLVGYNKPVDPTEDQSPKYIQAPRNIPPIYDGSQMVVFGVFPNGKPTGAKITAESPDGPLTLDLELSKENDVGSTKMVHRLAAIKIVRELELQETAFGFNFAKPFSGKTTKMEIIEIATRNGIASKYTSFVAVDEHSTNLEDNYCTMETRYVAQQIPRRSFSNPSRRLRKQRDASPSIGRSLDSSDESLPMNQLLMGPPSANFTTDLPRSTMNMAQCQYNPIASNVPIDFSGILQGGQNQMNDEVDDVAMQDLDDQQPRTLDLNVVHSLINLQSFQGSFPFNPAFVNIFAVDVNRLNEASIKNEWDETAWATSLAVVFLSDKLGEWKDYWELVANKALKWMTENHSKLKEEMLSAAKVLVNSI